MKTITATVVYPVHVTIEVEDDADTESIREKIHERAAEIEINYNAGVIHEASDEALVE